MTCHEGHLCCTDPDPHHSHFLDPCDCPTCEAADRPKPTANDVPLFEEGSLLGVVHPAEHVPTVLRDGEAVHPVAPRRPDLEP